MKFLVVLVIVIFAIACSPSATLDSSNLPDGERYCNKNEVKLGSLNGGTSVMLRNSGDCWFIASIVVNGSTRIGGRAYRPREGGEFYPSPEIIKKCELRLTIPSMKLPCEVYP